MTGQQMKEMFAYRRKMRSYLESGLVMEGADDWIRMVLHNQECEMRKEVVADMRSDRETALAVEEVAVEIKRPAGKSESKLRSRLKQLLSIILPRMEAERNA